MANRKNWLGILVIVLVFGMMVVGCSDGDSSQTLNDAIKILKKWGYTDTFYTPDQGTFDRYYTEEYEYDDYGGKATMLTILFKNSSTNDYTAYKIKWNAYLTNSNSNTRYEMGDWIELTLNNNKKIFAMVFFTPVSIEIGDIPVSSNSIVFQASKINTP